MGSTIVLGVLKYISEQILSSEEMQNRHLIKMQHLFMRKNTNTLGRERNCLILIKLCTKMLQQTPHLKDKIGKECPLRSGKRHGCIRPLLVIMVQAPARDRQ